MELKDYQRRVDEEVRSYLRALAGQRERGNLKHGGRDAWDSLADGLSLRRYEDRKNGLGEDLPTFCIKVPTGGGKTLLATQILGSIHRILMPERNGAGLVLWVVPSSQIYRDTLRRLRDRNDLYRLMLEHAVSRRIEVWEKGEIARLTPSRLSECLNILVFQLASVNRLTKEDLKFFRDSGGNIVQHFPAEDDLPAHQALHARMANLETIEGTDVLKTSVGNLVRLCRPPVILDEGHKAYSPQARKTIEGFNPSIVVELSATPPETRKGKGDVPIANVLCRVSGEELLREEMIKLPLNVATSGKKKWQDILTQARDKREHLARLAEKAQGTEGAHRAVRPIVLVQVQRTGKEQRAKGFIHAEDVKEHLIQRLDVHEHAIRIKSSEDDGLEDVNLEDPECAVTWIITKSALQEGWDCQFAYILVSLDNTGSARSLTQLVGRVLRQPHQKRFAIQDLNESYAYCLHEKPGEVLKSVKKALENEGYEGDAESFVSVGEGGGNRRTRETKWRPQFRDLYKKPFEGKIYLPRFCVREGDEYSPLDYFRHLVSRVDVDRFEYERIDWPLAHETEAQRERQYRVTLGEDPSRVRETDIDLVEPDEAVLSWLAANLDFPFLSHKQLRRIVRRCYEQICGAELLARRRLATVKTEVRNRLSRFIEEQVDEQTERTFGRLFDENRVLFYLHCAECRFEIPDSIEIRSVGPIEPLMHGNGDPVARSLFDFIEKEAQNKYEREVALVLDRDANVLWWYRNKVGTDNFMIQGYKRSLIYPDFVVQQEHEGKPCHRVLVLESKGAHLEGNPDTTYKRKVAKYFERAGRQVTWQQLGAEFRDHIFRFQVLDEAQPHGREWNDELRELLAADNVA